MSEKYTKPAIILHWLTAILVIGLLIMGLLLEVLPNTIKPMAYTLHKSFGLTVFFLTAYRLFWRLRHTPPAHQPPLPEWQEKAAKAAHVALYGLLFAMPFFGWLMATAGKYPAGKWFGLVAIPDPFPTPILPLARFGYEAHELCGYALIALILAHSLAGLYHYYVRKDGVLQSMLGRSNQSPTV